MQEVIVYLVIDEDGSFEIGTSKEEAFEKYNDNIGGTDMCIQVVEVKTRVRIPKPIVVIGKATEVDAEFEADLAIEEIR
jgi:hypothetical protein